MLRHKRLAFILVVLLGPFALLEVAARIYIPIRGHSLAAVRLRFAKRCEQRQSRTWPTQDRDHPYLPFMPKTEPPDVDMRGLRWTSPDEVKPPDVFRVFCLGGSTTYYNYPSKLRNVLADELAARGLRLEVVNAGNISWTSAESFINFCFRCLPYEPDAIIIYHGVNDAWAAFGPSFRPDYSHYRKRLSLNAPVFWDRLPRLFDRSAAYVQVRAWAEGERAIDTWAEKVLRYLPDFENDPYHGTSAYRRNLENIIAVARAHGVKVLLSTQIFNGDVPEKRLVAAIRECNEVVRSLADEANDVVLVDAAASIQGCNDLMHDVCHFRPNGPGEDMLVQVLADSLRSRLSAWVTDRPGAALVDRGGENPALWPFLTTKNHAPIQEQAPSVSAQPGL